METENWPPETFKDEPVVVVDRMEDGRYVVVDCRLCGETHQHGRVIGESSQPFAHRSAHCDGVSGYYLFIGEVVR
jgi:hypothetical protein